MPLRADFGIKNILDPTRGMRKSLDNFANTQMRISKNRSAEEQRAVDNKRAEERLGFQKSAEQRAIDAAENDIARQTQADAIKSFE